METRKASFSDVEDANKIPRRVGGAALPAPCRCAHLTTTVSTMMRLSTRPINRIFLVYYMLNCILASSGFAFRSNARERRRQGLSLSAFHYADSANDEERYDIKHCPIEVPVDRRSIILSAPVSLALALGAQSAHAVEPSTSVYDFVTGQGDLPQLEVGLLESRVMENVMSPPPYGMEGSDVFYPEWLAGLWKVKSTTTDVQAPCGTMLFGGNVTYAKARLDIGTFLEYESRFISDGNEHVIADREFNVKSIAKVAMGANSVVDVSMATPNKFSCLLSPIGSPSMLTVDLIILNRRQENVDDKNFHCSEVVREIVSPVGQSSSRPQSPLLKEIETTSLYRLISPNEVRCMQRSATFLLPSQQDQMAFKMWELSRGRPTDVRFFDVVYTKLR